jgi:hypothetical protein
MVEDAGVDRLDQQMRPDDPGGCGQGPDVCEAS